MKIKMQALRWSIVEQWHVADKTKATLHEEPLNCWLCGYVVVAVQAAHSLEG